MLTWAIQDEYRAEATYQSVLVTFGSDVTPFANIKQAETNHIGAATQLFTNRDLTVPPKPPALAPWARSYAEACEAGVAAETLNWTTYSGYLKELRTAGTLPSDVETVFTSLMEASRDKHLPAFTNCAK